MVQRGFPPVRAREMIDARDAQAREMLDQEMTNRPVQLTRAPAWHKFNIMAFYPRIVDDNVIRVSPLVVSGFNMDFDGDQSNFYVPVSDKAVQEAKDKMLPSSNLFKLTDLRTPSYQPSKEMLVGLYQMTRPPADRPPVVFRSVAEAKEAYANGLIGYNDPITIKGV